MPSLVRNTGSSPSKQPEVEEDPVGAVADRAVPSPRARAPSASLALRHVAVAAGGAAPRPPTVDAPGAPRCDGTRAPLLLHKMAEASAMKALPVPSSRPAPPSRQDFVAIYSALYATTPSPSYYAPVLPQAPPASSLLPRPYVPAAAAARSPASPILPLPLPRAPTGAALVRAQRPTPGAPGAGGAQAIAGLKNTGEAHALERTTPVGAQATAGLKNKGEDQARPRAQQPMPGGEEATGLKKKGEARALRRNRRPMPRIREQCTPLEQDMLGETVAFMTKNTMELNIIRSALMFIPKGPSSMLDVRDSSDDQGRKSELLMFGSIMHEPLKSIWEKQPLILHDADIVRAAESIGAQANLAQKITDILHMHPGPVRYFRVDSSRIDNGTEQLNEWFELLGRKKTKEVVFVNCSWPFDVIDFPINNLDCKYIETIRLCFVSISDICLHHVGNLTTITLSCCSINSQDLYALAYQCKHLKELGIAFYEGDVIRINSVSLEILTIRQCSVRKVYVQNPVKLQRLTVAAIPVKPSLDVGVFIEDGSALTDATFNLSVQFISIYSMTTKMENQPLPNLKRLVLHLSFKVEVEKTVLLKLMKSSMILTELILWRNDNPYPDEHWDAFLDDWSVDFNDLACLRSYLQVFIIKDFKDGATERAISSAVLQHACHLRELILEADSSQDDSIFSRAKRGFEKVIGASTAVRITCKIGFNHSDDFFC